MAFESIDKPDYAIEVGERIEVYGRPKTGVGEVDYDSISTSCEIVGIGDQQNRIIFVDDGKSIRLAQWVGSNYRCWRF